MKATATVEQTDRRPITLVREWLSSLLAESAPSSQRQPRVRVVLVAVIIVVVALGSRLLYWQDWEYGIAHKDNLYHRLIHLYRREAKLMADGEGILFPRQTPQNGDARLLVHPPGYAMLLAASYRLVGSQALLRPLQILADSAAAVMVFLIAAALFPFGLAATAGLLVALSPHFSYYSLYFSPDTLVVLPILIAIYLIIKAMKRPRFIMVAGSGLMLGVACWLRGNALMLAPLLSIVILFLFERKYRVRYAALLSSAMLLVIAPITIRNLIVFHEFIPLALPMGTNLIQGIAEFDREGRFGMPLDDVDLGPKDVEWHGRSDYGGSPWVPDGITRERERLSRGLAVVRTNPGWFAGVMLRRAAFMLRYNDSTPREWPFYTASVPHISRQLSPPESISGLESPEPDTAEADPANRFAPGGVFGAISGPFRRPLRALQINLFTTSVMLPLVVIGVCLMALARRYKALVVLLAVPAYYLISHSAFSTEYRYILTIHYFLFVMAATSIYSLCAGGWRSLRKAHARALKAPGRDVDSRP